MTQPADETIDKIENEFLKGEISYADYRRDLHHYYKSVLHPEPARDWRARPTSEDFGFDCAEREMGR